MERIVMSARKVSIIFPRVRSVIVSFALETNQAKA
jgi:hypothetical protein